MKQMHVERSTCAMAVFLLQLLYEGSRGRQGKSCQEEGSGARGEPGTYKGDLGEGASPWLQRKSEAVALRPLGAAGLHLR